MPKWRRNIFRRSKTSEKKKEENIQQNMMQSTTSRKSLLSQQQKQQTTTKDSILTKVAYNKENNGSDSESLFSQGGATHHEGGSGRVKSSSSSSSSLKKLMSASELLSKQQGWTKQQNTRNDNMSPSSKMRGRNGSDYMKYSSVSPPEQRCPSARTIINNSILDENVDESSASLSSESFRIMEEMNTVYEASPIPPNYIQSPSKKNISSMDDVDDINSIYEKSPIPSTYINSPPKKNSSSVDDINSIYENSPIQSKKKKSSTQATISKKRTEAASTWLKRNQTKTPTGGISSSTAKAYGSSMSVGGASSSSKRSLVRGSRRSSLSSAPNNNNRATGSASTTTTSKGKQPMALAVQREKQQRYKLNAEADSNETRTCLDKRTARLRYGRDFKADILQHRQQYPHLNNGSNHSDKDGNQINERSLNGVSIVVRKRPIFGFELNRGDYDIISIDNVGQSSSDSEDTICVDNPLMHPDMKQKLIKPVIFTAQAAFDEHCSDDDVYRNIAEPLINSVVREGVVSTILLYGQTGCGKSYTMSGIEERTARGIFQAIASLRSGNDNIGDDSHVNNTGQITLQFVELCGNKEINDLLSAKNKEAVKLLDDENGACRILNATSITISSSEQLLHKIKEAKSRRSTEATDKNGTSSRSHAVCQIRITGTKGVLTLLDLAGSERSGDSLWHSKERQQESAEINASLFALKECVRARASNNSRVPFRNHSLTRILRESFERDGARLCVIACISPNATDTEHTIETLRFAASIVGKDAQIREGETRLVATAIDTNESRNIQSPKQWDNGRLQKFLLHKKMDRVRLTEKHDGKALMKMSVPQMKSQLFDEKDSEQAKKLFNLLRLENDRVASIQRADRIKLSKARKGQS